MNTFNREPRDPDRITPMLAKVEELWKKCPQLRLGQLLDNCAKSDPIDRLDALYYMEDDVLLEKLEAMYNDVDSDE